MIHILLGLNDIFQNYLNLYGSTVIPISVVYNCSHNLIKIPNYFKDTKVIVLDYNFNYLPVYTSISEVSFYVSESESKQYLYSDLCLFNGYLAYNPKFNISIWKNGSPVTYIYFNNNSIFTIDEKTLKNMKLLFSESDISLSYDINSGCLVGIIKSVDLKYPMPTNNIYYLNIQNISRNTTHLIIRFNYTNPVCKLDLNKVYYILNDNYYRFNVTFSAYNKSLVNPWTDFTIYIPYSDNISRFCIYSLGIMKCFNVT